MKLTGVNPAEDAGDTSPNILVGGRQLAGFVSCQEKEPER